MVRGMSITGTGRMNERITIMNQKFLKRNSYRAKANPAREETMVWHRASRAEYQRELIRVFLRSSTTAAVLMLPKAQVLGIQFTVGLMMSSALMRAVVTMRSMGYMN